MPLQNDSNAETDAETLVRNSSSTSNQKTTTSRAELIGMTLGGRYLIERELGRGGMGVVYLARDKPELHSRPVVVKVLLEAALKNEFIVSKFYQEIESLTRLDDPGVVGIFDAGQLDDGTPYLVMQYVEGTTLRAAIKPEGMELQQAATIMRQVGRSVAAAHDAGIFHRDLKPENIMLRATAKGDQQVKIIDFGIAKVKNSVAGPATATGSTAGTIAYMSPEQLSAKPLTPASDIYALGMIAYEMVTGRRPFNPESIYQLLEMQRAGIRVKPCDLRPALPEPAQQVILRALAFDSGDRFQRADEFGDQLAAALVLAYEGSERTTVAKLDPSPQGELKNSFQTVAAQEPGAAASKATLETAHVLFMDIVGYSKMLIDEQTERLQELQEIVRNTQEFQRAQATNQLLRLPTGDGMALSFFGDAEAPTRCAVEISRALKSQPQIALRMGAHSGLVYRMADINANMNVAGGGINIAQRVMDCGDAGHILLSKRVADDLGQLGRWAKDLHDLGEAEVKHGVLVHVYNLYSDEIGNAAVPAKLRKVEKKARPGKRTLAIAVAGLFIAGLILTGFFILRSALTPVRTLAYSLTVQKMQKSTGNNYTPIGNEFQSTGEQVFGDGWTFKLNFTPSQAGSLYVLDKGSVNYNILFPTPENNNGLAQLLAGQTKQTKSYFFDENTGPEQIFIIWSAEPLSELDTIFKDAASHKLVIGDPVQIRKVQDLLDTYSSSRPEVEIDKTKSQTTLRGKGKVLVNELILNHQAY